MATNAFSYAAQVLYADHGDQKVYSLAGQVLYPDAETGIMEAYSLAAQLLFAANGDQRVYSLAAQLLYTADEAVKAYSYAAQVMYAPDGTMRVNSFAAQVLFRADLDPETDSYTNIGRMNIEEPDMIYYDVIFPECITYGSTGVPRYETEKSEVLSGDEQRQTRWDYAKHEYSVNLENMPANEQSEILNIWHVVKGDYVGFMFMDPIDHTSANTTDGISGTTVATDDQFVANAIGSQWEYPLFKEYFVGSRLVQRRIKYPKDGTIVVEADGNAMLDFSYDYDTSMLVFNQRYDELGRTTTKVGNQLTSSTNWGSQGTQVGDLLRFTGFTDSANDVTGDPVRVTNVAGFTITVENYDGSTYGTSSDEAGVSISYSSAPPPTDAVIKAGFYFYVPVRFDGGADAVAEIVAGMRETSFVTMGDLKLKEIFE